MKGSERRVRLARPTSHIGMLQYTSMPGWAVVIAWNYLLCHVLSFTSLNAFKESIE